MKKLTLNEFFYYSTPWEGDNSKRSGNQIGEKGWSSPVGAHTNLVIYQMPKETFSGKLVDINGRPDIHLPGSSITQIISSYNKVAES